MFEDMKNLAGLMGQARELGKKLEAAKAQLARRTVEADAGAGAVRVVANGAGEVVSIDFDKAMLVTLTGSGADADFAMVEELTVAAVNAALDKSRKLMTEELGKLTGGMNIPGLDRLMGGS